MKVNLEYGMVDINGIEYSIDGLDDVGFMVDEDYQGKFRVFNTKDVLSPELWSDDGVVVLNELQFAELCKAVEDEKNKELGWL